jgi:ribosomal protein L7/L12
MFKSQFSEDKFVDAFVRIAESLEKLVSRSPVPAAAKTFDDVRRLSCADQKIEAIKLFRELTGASLEDAKDQVDAMREFYGRFDRY